MRILLLVLTLLASAASGAAESRRFAVLSLIGDKLLVMQYTSTSSFQADQGLQAIVHLDDNSLDKTTLQAVDGALKAFDRTITPLLLVAKDTTLYDAQAELLASGRSSTSLLEKISPMLRGSGSTHLILVTKIRHEARVRELKDTYLGGGQLEGLGFYVDAGRSSPTATPDNPGLGGTPVLGPFAYYKLELIDIARSEIVKTEVVTASRVFANPGSANPWSTLSNTEKIATLQDILRRETAKAVPVLLGRPKIN